VKKQQDFIELEEIQSSYRRKEEEEEGERSVVLLLSFPFQERTICLLL
jgi:hypothetical protein